MNRIEKAIENLRRSLSGASSPARVELADNGSNVVASAFQTELIPPEPDQAIIELPDDCRTIAAVNVEADFFTCAHGRRWRMSVGEPRRVVHVSIVEVDPETGERLWP